MPKGEWVNNVDILLNSTSDGNEDYFEKGSYFTILDTDGKYVSLAQNGTNKLVIITIDSFHDNFDPHWRKSDRTVFKNNEAV